MLLNLLLYVSAIQAAGPSVKFADQHRQEILRLTPSTIVPVQLNPKWYFVCAHTDTAAIDDDFTALLNIDRSVREDTAEIHRQLAALFDGCTRDLTLDINRASVAHSDHFELTAFLHKHVVALV